MPVRDTLYTRALELYDGATQRERAANWIAELATGEGEKRAGDAGR